MCHVQNRFACFLNSLILRFFGMRGVCLTLLLVSVSASDISATSIAARLNNHSRQLSSTSGGFGPCFGDSDGE
jgi:hypothetical protein